MAKINSNFKKPLKSFNLFLKILNASNHYMKIITHFQIFSLSFLIHDGISLLVNSQ